MPVTPTPTLSGYNYCYQEVTINVVKAGDIEFYDCDKNYYIQFVTGGTSVIYGNCLNIETFNGLDAIIEVISGNTFCATPTATPLPTPTPTPTVGLCSCISVRNISDVYINFTYTYCNSSVANVTTILPLQTTRFCVKNYIPPPYYINITTLGNCSDSASCNNNPTPTPTNTVTPTLTLNPTPTPTTTPSVSPIVSLTPTQTPPPSTTPTITPTPTKFLSPTSTPNPTEKPTSTPLPTDKPTPTPYPTKTTCSCCCITFQNNGGYSINVNWTPCYGFFGNDTVLPGQTLKVCGSNPICDDPNLSCSVGNQCVQVIENIYECSNPTPTPTLTDKPTPTPFPTPKPTSGVTNICKCVKTVTFDIVSVNLFIPQKNRKIIYKDCCGNKQEFIIKRKYPTNNYTIPCVNCNNLCFEVNSVYGENITIRNIRYNEDQPVNCCNCVPPPTPTPTLPKCCPSGIFIPYLQNGQSTIFNFNGIPIKAIYSGPNNAIQRITSTTSTFDNCISTQRLGNPVLLSTGGMSGNEFTYTLFFDPYNQNLLRVNNIKLHIWGAGETSPNNLNTFNFIANNGTSSGYIRTTTNLSLCGQSCHTTLSGTTVKIGGTYPQDLGGAIIQVSGQTIDSTNGTILSDGYRILNIKGKQRPGKGIYFWLCEDFDIVYNPITTPTPTPTKTPSPTPTPTPNCKCKKYINLTPYNYEFAAFDCNGIYISGVWYINEEKCIDTSYGRVSGLSVNFKECCSTPTPTVTPLVTSTPTPTPTPSKTTTPLPTSTPTPTPSVTIIPNPTPTPNVGCQCYTISIPNREYPPVNRTTFIPCTGGPAIQAYYGVNKYCVYSIVSLGDGTATPISGSTCSTDNDCYSCRCYGLTYISTGQGANSISYIDCNGNNITNRLIIRDTRVCARENSIYTYYAGKPLITDITTCSNCQIYPPATGNSFSINWATTVDNPCNNNPWTISPNNLSIRYDVTDALNCGGTCDYIQSGTAIATIQTGPVNKNLSITVTGLAELQFLGYERLSIVIDGVEVETYMSPGGLQLCAMGNPISVTYTPGPYTFLANSAHTVELYFTTLDKYYHIGAFYQVTLNFI